MTGHSSGRLEHDCSDGSDQSWCETFVVEKTSHELEGSASYQYKRSELFSVHDATGRNFVFEYKYNGYGGGMYYPPNGSVSYAYVNNKKYGPMLADKWHSWRVFCDSRCDCLVKEVEWVGDPPCSNNTRSFGW